MSQINPQGIQDTQFTPAKTIAHPDAIKISVDSFFKIYDKNGDGRLSKSDLKEALAEIFRDFDVSSKVTDKDVQSFLIDFNISHDDVTMDDFKGVEFIRFDLQSNMQKEKQEGKDIY